MASSLTRGQIVSQALKLAGRGQELKEFGETCLNTMLRHWAQSKRFPQLRKVGSEVTLGGGSSLVALPSDFGAGMESILIGSERLPLNEIGFDEFLDKGFFPRSNPVIGKPTYFSIDENGGQIYFNTSSDQNYSLIPVYFRLPDDIPLGGTGDNEKVWHSSDDAVIQSLVKYVYQFNGDPRELNQLQVGESMAGDYRRGKVGNAGGVQRIRLAGQFFRGRR